jgi:hypothetical protein
VRGGAVPTHFFLDWQPLVPFTLTSSSSFRDTVEADVFGFLSSVIATLAAASAQCLTIFVEDDMYRAYKGEHKDLWQNERS